jgi:rRNA biogenesis protein RRP5
MYPVKVLVVDPERNRLVLTAKKTLLDSDLPVVSRFEDVKVGVVAHAVILKVFEKNLVIEFYNKLQASVPAREARYFFYGIVEISSDKLCAVKQV